MTETFRITLICRDRALERRALAGALLSDVLRAEGFAPSFDCGGRGRCGRCAVPVRLPGQTRFESRRTCQTRIDRDGFAVDVSALRRQTRSRGEEPLAAPAERGMVDERFPATSEERRGSLGLAIDLGTTTLASALVSLASGRVLATTTRRNPQASFGRDVVSRIAAASGSGAATMRRLVCEELGRMATTLVDALGASTRQIEDVVVAGNTTMEFLLTGRDPAPLGAAPFDVGDHFFEERRAAAFPFGVELAPSARARVFPVFSAFVGGDVLAGFEYLRRFGFEEGTRLFLDVGTNGEAILAANGRYFATSTAAGPAFEGAEISQGALAVPGAIAAIEYNAERQIWRPRTIASTAATCVCGSGLVDALAGALEFGLVAPSGRVASHDDPSVAAEFRARLRGVGRQRAFLISEPSELASTGGVWLTQNDVRQAQLAICAMKTGLRLTLMAAGIEERALDALMLAGAFGASLNVESSRRVGMFPASVPVENVSFWGNTSLLGAIDAVAGRLDWSRAAEDVGRVEHVDLATRPEFTDVFADCGRFPERRRNEQ